MISYLRNIFKYTFLLRLDKRERRILQLQLNLSSILANQSSEQISATKAYEAQKIQVFLFYIVYTLLQLCSYLRI